MKDIKSLYLTAKSSGKSTDISAYSEAINELLEANPNGYISNLEYIISSSIGLDTLDGFIENYGLPIAYYDTLTDMLECCKHKAELTSKDSSKYEEELEKLESFRKKYIGCFMMESYFHDMISEKYIETYYSLNNKGIQNRKLLSGMIEKFGEAAIPDLIITSDNIGGSSMNTLVQYIENHNTLGTSVMCEWILEATKNILPENDSNLLSLESYSLEKIINDMRIRNDKDYRESVIMGNDNAVIKYNESELNAIQDLILINEYKLTWADELNESVLDIQNSIYSLYEEFDGLVDGNMMHIIESGKSPSSIAHDIIKNINNVRKEIKELVKHETRNKVREHNKNSGLFDKIQQPMIFVSIKNNMGLSLITNSIKKHISDITDSKKQFIDTIYLEITFKITTGTKNNMKKSFNVYREAMFEALIPMKNKGEISFKKDSNNMYISFTYIQIPIYISKDRILNGIDLNFEESGINFEEFVADNVIPMLPRAEDTDVDSAEESTWITNTKNKKTGDAPGYLQNNHNLGYGEDNTKPKSDDSDDEIKLDNFKRPSSDNNNNNNNNNNSTSSLEDINDITDEKDDDNKEMTPAEKQAAINNYYYYTYTNSLNKNTTGSFNKDNSTHTSTSTKKTVDDHSNNKRINSDNGVSSDSVGESVIKQPWELDIFDENLTLYDEGFKYINDTMSESTYFEDVGDADNDRPQSDHPVKDVLTDIDRNLMKKQQGAKKTVQNIQNVGRIFVKPVHRTQQWITNMVSNWKDADENNVKEKMADPHARSNLFSAIKAAIVGGSLLKAGILLNPVFLFLSITRGVGKNKREFRIRNEMIGELKTELQVIEEKIKDADRAGDNSAKYKLMRLKNEINKKLLRVGGHKSWKKMI